MIRVQSRILNISVFVIICFTPGIVYPIIYRRLSEIQISFIRSDTMIAILLCILNLFILAITLIRIKRIKKYKVPIKTARLFKIKIPIILLITIVIFLFFLNPMNAILLELFLILFIINAILTDKSICSVSKSHIYYLNKLIPLKNIEKYAIEKNLLIIQTLKKVVCVGIESTYKIPITVVQKEALQKNILIYK